MTIQIWQVSVVAGMLHYVKVGGGSRGLVLDTIVRFVRTCQSASSRRPKHRRTPPRRGYPGQTKQRRWCARVRAGWKRPRCQSRRGRRSTCRGRQRRGRSTWPGGSTWSVSDTVRQGVHDAGIGNGLDYGRVTNLQCTGERGSNEIDGEAEQVQPTTAVHVGHATREEQATDSQPAARTRGRSDLITCTDQPKASVYAEATCMSAHRQCLHGRKVRSPTASRARCSRDPERYSESAVSAPCWTPCPENKS